MKTIELYKIEAYRGQTSPDPKLVSDYLMSLDINEHRRHPEAWSILYQDVVIPEPYHELIQTITEEIITQTSEVLDSAFELLDPVWCIRHDLNNQTFPHSHNNGPYDWACVYWASTPRGSGNLEYYPMGLPGPMYNIQTFCRGVPSLPWISTSWCQASHKSK